VLACFFDLRLEVAPQLYELRFAAPLHVIDLRGGEPAGILDFALRVPTRVFYLGVRRVLCLLERDRRDAPHILDLTVRLAARVLNLLLRGAAHFVELPLQRRFELGYVRFGCAPDFVGVTFSRFSEIRDLRIGLATDVRSSHFGCLVRGADTLVRRTSHQLVRKCDQLRIQLRPDRGCGTVERLANVFVEWHGSQYCT
jgi:hypothetical protein